VSESAQPESESRSAPGLGSILEPLPFHRAIVEYLRTQEAELWNWFSSTTFLDEYAATTRLALLKSCYRFDPADHGDVYALVHDVRERLGLSVPVTLYHSQSVSGMNAALCYVPKEAHLVLEGPIRTTLSLDEQRAIFAHELAHYLLWERQDGALLVADQMLNAMCSHVQAAPSQLETARLFRLYLEVHCDRMALAACPDPLVAISALIKVQTGLADAQAESYLRQSDEIFGQTDTKAEAVTHPETFIRARALKLWADGGDAAEAEITRMIEGVPDLGRLSLLGQQRYGDVTRQILARFLAPVWLRSDAIVAHARLFFPDLDPAAAAEMAPETLAGAFEKANESLRKYACYVLLDLATVDPGLEQAPLAAALRVSQELGIDEAFLSLAGQELDLTKRALARLKKDSAKLEADAAGAAPAEP